MRAVKRRARARRPHGRTDTRASLAPRTDQPQPLMAKPFEISESSISDLI